MQSIEDLANAITSLSPTEQQSLLEKVAQLNLQKGLRELSEKYRARLAREGKLDIPTDEVWNELHRLREEIANRDYPD
jgi:hypothetical protein